MRACTFQPESVGNGAGGMSPALLLPAPGVSAPVTEPPAPVAYIAPAPRRAVPALLMPLTKQQRREDRWLPRGFAQVLERLRLWLQADACRPGSSQAEYRQ